MNRELDSGLKASAFKAKAACQVTTKEEEWWGRRRRRRMRGGDAHYEMAEVEVVVGVKMEVAGVAAEVVAVGLSTLPIERCQ